MLIFFYPIIKMIGYTNNTWNHSSFWSFNNYNIIISKFDRISKIMYFTLHHKILIYHWNVCIRIYIYVLYWAHKGRNKTSTKRRFITVAKRCWILNLSPLHSRYVERKWKSTLVVHCEELPISCWPHDVPLFYVYVSHKYAQIERLSVFSPIWEYWFN